jgi:hypothetical protein
MTPRTVPKTQPRATIVWLATAAIAALVVVLTGSPALALAAFVQDTDRANTRYGNWMFT